MQALRAVVRRTVMRRARSRPAVDLHLFQQISAMSSGWFDLQTAVNPTIETTLPWMKIVGKHQTVAFDQWPLPTTIASPSTGNLSRCFAYLLTPPVRTPLDPTPTPTSHIRYIAPFALTFALQPPDLTYTDPQNSVVACAACPHTNNC